VQTTRPSPRVDLGSYKNTACSVSASYDLRPGNGAGPIVIASGVHTVTCGLQLKPVATVPSYARMGTQPYLE